MYKNIILKKLPNYYKLFYFSRPSTIIDRNLKFKIIHLLIKQDFIYIWFIHLSY